VDVSADYGTEHYKGYAHDGWIHVTHRDDGEPALGAFTLAEITELAALAGQAWPDQPGVEVRYVIECRHAPGRRWRTMWSAPAAEEDSDDGVSQEFAEITCAGFTQAGSGGLEWRLARRTTLTCDEPITPGGAS
jgi:hypothetical protein